MSDVELTEAERLTDAEREDWCAGCAGGESDCTCLVRIVEHHARRVAAAARAEGARDALKKAADWLDSDETNPPPEALEPLRQQDWEDGVLVACDWLRERTDAVEPATPHDDRPGGCLHGPGARPGVCPNCGTVVSEAKP